MLQRKQSIYLFLAFLVNSLVFFMPLSTIVTVDGEIFQLLYNGIISEGGTEILSGNEQDAEHLIFIFSLTSLLSLGTIFLYKNRKLQMRLCRYNIMLLIGIYVLISYYLLYLEGVEYFTYDFALIFPFIAIIFTFLAYRGIKADEDLIRSSERIR